MATRSVSLFLKLCLVYPCEYFACVYVLCTTCKSRPGAHTVTAVRKQCVAPGLSLTFFCALRPEPMGWYHPHSGLGSSNVDVPRGLPLQEHLSGRQSSYLVTMLSGNSPWLPCSSRSHKCCSVLCMSCMIMLRYVSLRGPST